MIVHLNDWQLYYRRNGRARFLECSWRKWWKYWSYLLRAWAISFQLVPSVFISLGIHMQNWIRKRRAVGGQLALRRWVLMEICTHTTNVFSCVDKFASSSRHYGENWRFYAYESKRETCETNEQRICDGSLKYSKNMKRDARRTIDADSISMYTFSSHFSEHFHQLLFELSWVKKLSYFYVKALFCFDRAF